jgi:predicted Holliday junction resolvase-like endonuclease
MTMTPSQPPSHADIATLNVRMANVEKDVEIVQKQLQTYVSQQVSDLQFKNMQQTLDRIERDQQDGKQEQSNKLETMNTKIDNLKSKGLERTINVIGGVGIGVLVTVIGTGLVYFFMHIGG